MSDTVALAVHQFQREEEGSPAAEIAAPLPEILIQPRSGWQLLNLAEVWRFRELCCLLTWRNLQVRYKQTFLGVAWAIVQPVVMMVVFTIFLRGLAGISSGDVPYPVFVYAGLLPWLFFSGAVSSAANSVVASEQLITKVYFPRLLIPLAAIGASFVDFLIAGGVLAVLMLWYAVGLSWSICLLPLPLLLLVCAAVGIGSLLAALNVTFRDFRYLVVFLMQVWMFATPSVYLAWPLKNDSAAATNFATGEILATCNPLTGVVAAFRACLLGEQFPITSFVIAAAIILPATLFSLYCFRRAELSFADII